MSSYFYYGFSGKRFAGEDIERAVELLSTGRLNSGINLYQGGTGFYEYAIGCCCFIISNDIHAIKVKHINKSQFPFIQKAQRVFFSEYEDEWRIRKDIPLSSIIGIGLPFEQVKIFDWNGKPYFQSQLQKLFMVAQSLGLDIVDSSGINFPTDYEMSKSISDKRIYDDSLEKLVSGNYCSKFFYHGLRRNRSSVDKLFRILTTGGIKCKRLLEYQSSYGYNGSSFVSVCKKYPNGDYQKDCTNAFYDYVNNSFCLIISDDIHAIKVGLDDIQPNSLDKPYGLRVSDMFDEWQVYEQIPLSAIIGIGIPLKKLKKFMSKLQREDFEQLRSIIMLARELGLDIVDSSEDNFVEKYEHRKLENPNKVYQIAISLYNN